MMVTVKKVSLRFEPQSKPGLRANITFVLEGDVCWPTPFFHSMQALLLYMFMHVDRYHISNFDEVAEKVRLAVCDSALQEKASQEDWNTLNHFTAVKEIMV